MDVCLTGAAELLAVLAARGRPVQVVTHPAVPPGPEPRENAHLRVRDDYLVLPESEYDLMLKTLIVEHFGVGGDQV